MSDAIQRNMGDKEHKNTYELFINLVKYGTATTALVLVLMAVFLLG